MPQLTRRGPLAATLERLGAADEWCRFLPAVSDEPGWTSVEALLGDEAALRAWFDQLMDAETIGHRDVAASYVASWLAAVVVEGPATALRTESRTWPLRPDGLLAHRHAEGWIDGIAVLADDVRVLPDDPDAGHPDVEVVGDVEQLRQQLASDAVALLDPLFDRLRGWAPFGKAGMWGTAADVVMGGAVWAARRAGTDGDAAFASMEALVEELAALVPVLRVRPSLVTVPWSGGVASLPRKGTCCLWYKTQTDPDPCGEGYCSSCPLRDVETQVARWSKWLEDEASA